MVSVAAWLRREIEASFAPPWHGAVERGIFGDLGPDDLVEAIDGACMAGFGSGLDDGFLYRVSVGCVAGCRLRDGRTIVVKAYQPRWTPAFLAAVKRVQSHLHDGGFPCPAPVGPILEVAGAVALAEELLVDPGLALPTEETMRASAAGLAEVVERCRALDEPALALHPLRLPYAGVFPEPHSPIFDFAGTGAGAEWIEATAARARALLDEEPKQPVIAHTDWSIRNVRFGPEGVVAAYDWDSLALLAESEALGGASVSWCKSGEGDDLTPSAEQIDGYIAAYESASNRPLSAIQRRSARAAAVWAMSYTARCEHCVDPHEERWTTTRPRLRQATDALLAWS